MVFQNGIIKKLSLLLCGILIFTLLSCANENGDDLQYEEQVPAASGEDVHYAENAASARSVTIQNRTFGKIATRINLSNMDLTDEDIVILAELTNLKELNLRDNQISDLRPLSELTNLRRLFLCGNQIRDLSPLSGLTYLEFLSLGDNQISDVSPLVDLTNLEHLNLKNNQISDLTPLARTGISRHLILSNNQIGDVTPLIQFAYLSNLELDNNQISDAKPLVNLPNLRRLSLRGNPIENFASLAELNYSVLLSLDGKQKHYWHYLTHVMLNMKWEAEEPEAFDLNNTQRAIFEKLRYAGMLYTELEELYGSLTEIAGGDGTFVRMSTKENKNEKWFVVDWDAHHSIHDPEAVIMCFGVRIRLGTLVPDIQEPLSWWQLTEKLGAHSVIFNYDMGGPIDGFNFRTYISWIPELMRAKYPECEFWKNRNQVRVIKRISENPDDVCLDTWVYVVVFS